MNTTTADLRQSLRSRAQLRTLAAGLMLLLTVTLMAVWASGLLHRPRLTPYLRVAIADYDAILPPIIGTAEQRTAWGSLDNRNLKLIDLGADWRGRQSSLASLDSALADLHAPMSSPAVVVLHLIGHGRVDGEGRPHFLSAESSVLQSRTWLPMDELFDHVRDELPTSTRKLVILDLVHHLTHTASGQVYSTFVDRTSQMMETGKYPNLTIVTSTAAEQIAWTDSKLGGSVFEHFSRRALAGAADQPSQRTDPDSSYERAGNGNGIVDVQEWLAYVDANLKRWTDKHGMPLQSVRRFPSNGDNFDLSWSIVDDVDEEGLLTSSISIDAINLQPVVADDELDEMWRRIESLPILNIQSVAPEVVGNLHRDAMRLENLSRSGADQLRTANRLHNDIRRRLDSLEALVTSDQPLSPITTRMVLMEDTPLTAMSEFWLDALPPSLSLASTMGAMEDSVHRDLVNRLESMNQLDAEAIDAFGQLTSAATRTASGLTDDAVLDVEQWLRLVKRYQILDRWRGSAVVAKALRLRMRADRLASLQTTSDHFSDLRGMNWAYDAIQVADGAVAKVEDFLIAGPPQSDQVGGKSQDTPKQTSPGIDDALKHAETALDSAEARINEVAHVQQISDRATIHLPFLIDAVSRSVTPTQPSPDRETENALSGAADSLVPAIRDAVRLARQLDRRSENLLETDSIEFFDTADRLRERMQSIEQVIDQSISLWISGTGMLPSRHELDLVFGLTSLSLEQRRQLRQLRREIESFDSDDDPKFAAAGKFLPTLDMALQWEPQPAIAWLEGVQDQATQSETRQVSGGEDQIERAGYRLRRDLVQSAGELLARFSDDAEKNSDTASLDPVAATDRRLRRQVGWGRIDSPSAIGSYWEINAQRFLLTHAARQLNQFLGSPTSRDSDRTDPFFLRGSNAALRMAQRLGTIDESLTAIYEQLRLRQAALSIDAESGLQISAKPEVAIDGEASTVQVDLQSSSSNLPNAGISIWVANSRNEASTTVATVAQPDALPSAQVFDLDQVDQSGAELSAVATIRGNEFRQSFLAGSIAGALAKYNPQPTSETTITVSGERRQRSSVMFILDCSRSMGERLAGEVSIETAPSRLTIAKNALSEMIDELSEAEGTRVGVLFFGHRVAWSRSYPPQRVISGSVQTQPSDEIQPSEDVETVLPLGRFETGDVFTRLDTVEPWGQSPLYLSILTAMEAFRSDDPDTDKSIVVITDGRDYQFTPASSDIPRPNRIVLNDVLRAAQSAEIPVHVLGFKASEDVGAELTEAEFNQIARATGGEFNQIENAPDLLRRLRDSLPAGQFEVGTGPDDTNGIDSPMELAPASSGRPERLEATLNQTITVPDTAIVNGSVELVFEDIVEPLPVSGGEAIQLRISDDGRRFESIPFDRYSPVTIPLVDQSGSRSAYLVRLHRPEPDDDQIVFPISIQSNVDPVTRRPAEFYATITPISSGREMIDHRYRFYEPIYEPGRPVPMVRCVAAAWPQEADAAAIRFQCKFQPTAPAQTVELSDVLQSAGRTSIVTVDGFESIDLTISATDRGDNESGYAIQIVERHKESPANLDQIQVHFRTADRYVANSITHRDDQKNALVIHTYTYEADDAAGIERSPKSRIEILRSKDARQNSIHPAGRQSFDVTWSTADDLLPAPLSR